LYLLRAAVARLDGFSKWLPHSKGANLNCICRSQVQ